MAFQQQTAIIAPNQGGDKVRLVDGIRAAMRATKLEIGVAFPCTVKSFNPETQLVDVEGDFLTVLQNIAGVQVQDPEVLPHMLVAFEGQGRLDGGYLTFPIQPGDKGYITVTDRSLENWIQDGLPRDPEYRHTHSKIDGIFKPLRDISRAIPSFDSVAAVLESTFIKLGANATEAAAFGTALQSWANAITTTYNLHTHLDPLSGSTGVPSDLFPTPVPTLASTKVKVE